MPNNWYWFWFWFNFFVLLLSGARVSTGQVSTMGTASKVYGGSSSPPAARCATASHVGNIWVDRRATPGTAKFYVCVNDDGAVDWALGGTSVTTHGLNHGAGQTDEVELTQAQITGLVAALAAKQDTVSAGDGIAIAGAEVSTDPATVPEFLTGDGAPSSSCTAGRHLYLDTTGYNYYYCSAADTWTKALKTGGVAASDVASGTLATARGGTNLDTSSSTGVAKVASGTWSVAALAGSDLPNPGATSKGGVYSKTCTAGDFVSTISSSDGSVTCTTPSSGGGGWDVTKYTVFDDFVTGDTASGRLGSQGWSAGTIVSGGSVAFIGNPPANNPGMVRLTTAGTAGNGYYVGSGNISVNTSINIGTWTAENWEIDVLFMPGSNSTAITDIRMRIGLVNAASAAVPTAGAWWRFDKNSSYADSTFMFQSCDSSTGCNAATTGTDTIVTASTITPSAGTVYRFRIRRSGSTIYFRINDETELSHADTEFITSGNMMFAIIYATDSNNVRSGDLDAISITIPGLVRY